MIVAIKREPGIFCVEDDSGLVIADFDGLTLPEPEEIASHQWFCSGGGAFRFVVWGMHPDAQAKMLDRYGGRLIRVADLGVHPPLHVCVAIFRDRDVAIEAAKWLRELDYVLMPAEPELERDAPSFPGRRPLPGPRL